MAVASRAYPKSTLQTGIKRWIDLCGGLLGLIVFSPLFFLIPILIKLETGGKIFYDQERVGRGGSRFVLYKFRTMQDYSQEELKQLLKRDPITRLENERYQKLPEDPRLTRVGRLLRKSSLDELPQFWNVLRGEMSLVGPRPFLPEQLRLYGPAYVNYQKFVPGMTGLWQVSGRNHLSFAERVRLDEKYAQEWSLLLDIKILLITPWAVLSQNGAY